MFIGTNIYVQVDVLYAGFKPGTNTWFLEINFVRSAYICMYVCMYAPGLLITSGVQVLQLFYGSFRHYGREHGLRIEVHCRDQPCKT